MKFILVILCLTIFFKSNAQIQTDCKAIIVGDKEVFPSFEQCKQYITNYRDNFQNHWETHTRAIYFNAETFLFLDEFFVKHSAYEGINIHFSIYGDIVSPSQKDKNQFIIYLTPTKGLENHPSDYTAFKAFQSQVANTYPLDKINNATYCPNECDDFTRDWGHLISYRPLTSNIGGGYDGILVYEPTLLKKFKKEYKKKTRVLFFGNKKHTLSFYFSKSKISRLADFIRKDTNKDFPSIAVYFISYNKEVSDIGQAHEKQISLGVVPMRKIGTTLSPDFCAYNEFIRKYHLPAIIKENTIDGELRKKSLENHSELCPEKCPPGEN